MIRIKELIAFFVIAMMVLASVCTALPLSVSAQEQPTTADAADSNNQNGEYASNTNQGTTDSSNAQVTQSEDTGDNNQGVNEETTRKQEIEETESQRYEDWKNNSSSFSKRAYGATATGSYYWTGSQGSRFFHDGDGNIVGSGTALRTINCIY